MTFTAIVLLARLGTAISLAGMTAFLLLLAGAHPVETAPRRRGAVLAAMATVVLGVALVAAMAACVLHRLAGWRVIWGPRLWVGRVAEIVVALLAIAGIAVTATLMRRGWVAARSR